MRAPTWDLGFPHSRMHGIAAQRALIRSAIKYCKRKRVAVDAGAHIGLTAVELGERFDFVVAFEPVEENFECLIYNAPHNVLCIDAALGQEAGQCSMFQPGENSGCWSMRVGNTARVTTLDSISLVDVDFIKIDVEGAEGFVVKGAVDLLERCRPVILLESNGLGQKFFGPDWVDPSVVLHELGYRQIDRIQKNEIWAC